MRLSNFIIETASSKIVEGTDNNTPTLLTKGSELVNRQALFASGLQSDNLVEKPNPIINLIAGDITFTELDVLEQKILSSGTVKVVPPANDGDNDPVLDIIFGTVVVAAGVNEG